MGIRHPLSKDTLEQLIKEIQPLKIGFDSLRIHTVITDENANILYANDAVSEQTGFPKKAVIGKNPGDLWGGHMPVDFYRNMWHVIKDEKMPFTGEIKNRHADGTDYWQEIHISPLLDKKGQTHFFIGIEPDISDRKQRDTFREEFISLLAHQAQSPLAAIRWSLELLLEKSDLAPEHLALLTEVYKRDRMLIDLIGDLLILSRIGKIELKKEVIDLAAELNKEAEQAKPLFPKVEIEIPDLKKLPITTRAQSLAVQVFSNIFNNAIKYADPDKGRVTVNLDEKSNKYLLTISNNGKTISPDEQSRIFEKFYRGSNAKESGQTGTGLGLYITKLICDNFNWKIDFKSPDSQGLTTFTLHIPKE